MERWGSVSLGEAAAAAWRQRRFVAIVVLIAVVAVVAPGPRPEPDDDLLASTGGQVVVPGQVQGDTGFASAGGATPATGVDASSAAPGGTGTAGADSAGAGPAAVSSGGAAKSVAKGALQAADCDAGLGRVRMPSKFAPPCVNDFAKGADNGGATHRGVSKSEIVVAIRYNPNPNPAVSATLIAAGAEDTREDVQATYQAWADYFEAHHQTYGRKVKIVWVPQSGDSDDEAAGRADAIKVATELKAFAAWGGSGTYREELVARGVLCLCGGRDAKYFTDRAPLLWGTQPGYEQWLWPAAEYIGKRLAGRNAKWAGDAVFQTQKRKIAIVFLDSATDPATFRGVESMERELAKHGARFADKISYTSDTATAQEQARVTISRLKEKGITTVAFWGDPLAPIFLTQTATQQGYFPEWVLVGGNLVDTTFFSRTYDQTQWSHAFGISQLWARGPQAQSEVYFQHVWHHGAPPQAKATYEIIYQTPWMFYTGLHLAGPKLTPATFKAGLFSFPPSGGGPTLVRRSFGKHGYWPFEDYTSFDDVTEVWYDPNAVGENEIGQSGKGMLRYVDGGRRYLLGQWPTTEPKVFDANTAIVKYDAIPASDQYPRYEHKHFR